MPKKTDTSEFTVRQVCALITDVPFLKDDTFATFKQLGEFMIEVPCPVQDMPGDDDGLRLGVYMVWLTLVRDHTMKSLTEQMEAQYPEARFIREVESPEIASFRKDDVFAAVDELTERIADHGIDLDRVLTIRRKDKAYRASALKNWNDEDYLRECYEAIKTFTQEAVNEGIITRQYAN